MPSLAQSSPPGPRTDAHAVLTLCFRLRKLLDGTPERKLLFSHAHGRLTMAQYASCTQAADLAAGCVEAFYRQAFQKNIGK